MKTPVNWEVTLDLNNTATEMKQTAHNVAMRLNDNDHKFLADLAQCWEEFNYEYDQVIENYGLPENQSLQFLRNLLWKEAHRIYHEMVNLVPQFYIETFLLIK